MTRDISNEIGDVDVATMEKEREDMTPDIADMYEDLQVETAAAAEAKRVIEREAEEKARYQARWDRDRMYMKRIGAALPTGTVWETSDRGGLKIEGVKVSWDISIENQRKHISSWRSVETDKIRLVVTDSYGKNKSYPERKDGTHDYVQIANTLLEVARQRAERQKTIDLQKQNREIVEAVREELGCSEYGNFRMVASSSTENPLYVTFKFSQTMNVEQAKALYAKIKELGLA